MSDTEKEGGRPQHVAKQAPQAEAGVKSAPLDMAETAEATTTATTKVADGGGSAVAEEEEEDIVPPTVNGNSKPRLWLLDRCNGQSKVDIGDGVDNDGVSLSRPFCPMCWPPPCVKWLPDILEQNLCCEKAGALGVFPEDDSRARTWLMVLSMVTHFVGGIFSILACFALSTQMDLLKTFSFSSGTVTGTVGGAASDAELVDIQDVFFRVGLTHVYVEDFFFGPRVFPVGELCTGKTLGIPLTSLEDCHACKDVSAGLVITMIMGVVTYIPTIASNVNRMYYNYDVNCQKIFGTVVACFSMAMSLYTWKDYADSCYSSFYSGEVKIPVLVPKGTNATTYTDISAASSTPFYSEWNASFWDQFMDEDNTTPIDPSKWGLNETLLGETEVHIARVNFDWKPGLGLILIVIATFVKLIDIINHFLLKTPSITRDSKEQWEYEKAHTAEREEQADAEEGTSKDD